MAGERVLRTGCHRLRGWRRGNARRADLVVPTRRGFGCVFRVYVDPSVGRTDAEAGSKGGVWRSHQWCDPGCSAHIGVARFRVLGRFSFDNLNNPDLFTNSFFFSVLSVLLTIFIGRAYDIQRNE